MRVDQMLEDDDALEAAIAAFVDNYDTHPFRDGSELGVAIFCAIKAWHDHFADISKKEEGYA